MVRLFIALLLPDSLKQMLNDLILDLKPRGRGIRWVVAKNMHLTLKFIGEVPEDQIEPIGLALTRAVESRNSLEVRLGGLGGFPNLDNPRVLWAGLEGAEPAVEMAGVIDRNLSELGLPKEKRPFSPHLTLGRIKRKDNLQALATYMRDLTCPTASITLNQVALVKSTLTPSGPIYENLKLITLE